MIHPNGNKTARPDYVRTICRFAFRALLLAGRFPWLAFFNLRDGLAMTETP
jgi:hypothetical protein